MKTGVYSITNLINNKKYIGQSKTISQRIRQHKPNLDTNTHHNRYLQRAWNKYGKGNFTFNVLCECSEKELNNKEIYFINFYDSIENGYNLKTGGEI